MPESYQQERCRKVDDRFRTMSGTSMFERFVLIDETEGLDRTIKQYYKYNGLTPTETRPTAFFLDRRQGTYFIDDDVEFAASFALVGISSNDEMPTVRPTNAFQGLQDTPSMFDLDSKYILGNRIELALLFGVHFDPNVDGETEDHSLLDTTFSSRGSVTINNFYVIDCHFSHFLHTGQSSEDDHDEHILIRNAVGNVSIVNNIFENHQVGEKAVEIRCRPSKGTCNTEVLFRYNDIHSSDITSALWLEDIPAFTINTNTVSFGRVGSSTAGENEAVFRIFYDDPNGVEVRGSIQKNQIRGMGGNTNAFLIQADGQDMNNGGAESGRVYHSGNLFGDYPRVSRLPGIELIAGVPPEMAATTMLLTTDMPTTTAVPGTTRTPETTTETRNPTTEPTGQSTSTPPVTSQTTLASDFLPPSTTLPIRTAANAGIMACENQCGVSAGEAVGFAFLTMAEAFGIYEISALIAFMGNHWGDAGAQIPKYWDYITLGVVYGLKRWGPIATGVSDELALTEDGVN